jgi:cell division protein FtsW
VREAVRSSVVALQRPQAAYYLLLGASVLLLSLGLVMVLSASSIRSYADGDGAFAIVRRQGAWLALGLPLMALASLLPPRAWRLLAYPSLILAIGLLCLVPVLGTEVRGNNNWIQIGGFNLQPSEPAKLAFVVWGADLLARKERLIDTWTHLLVPIVPVGGLLMALVLLGDDLGTAMILAAVLAGLLWVAGAPLRLFVLLGALGAVAITVLSRMPGSQYRMRRIASWLDPTVDPAGIGYQALHGKYAMGTGGWFGVGLGASREKLPGALPEAHTDFIFAIIGEELGLFGTVTVLLLFAAIGYAGFRVALRAEDCFVRLAAGAGTTWILVQALVNIGAVVGLLPITGIPLPLVSYGGSALLPTMIALGMLMSFARLDALGRLGASSGPRRVPPARPVRSPAARPVLSPPARARPASPVRPVHQPDHTRRR